MVLFWFSILAISMLMYVLLDGFGLGIGMLFFLTTDERRRAAMMSAVAPVWDANQTWLVVTGVVLWATFPIVYAIVLSAFYLPMLLMLAGLVVRGVTFEFRHRSQRMRPVWDAGFAVGSTITAFVQGAAIGALVRGLPVVDGRYVGGALGWLSPFAVLCGIGLCVGYALLGACWLVRKCEGDVREAAYRSIPRLAVAVLVFLAVVFGYALNAHLSMLQRWFERPYLLVFPAIGALAAIVLTVSVRRRRDGPPYTMAALTFGAAFLTLAISFWPYLIPFSITLDEGAAPASTLEFMFWGGVVVFPMMLVYTAIGQRVFEGKASVDPHAH